MRRKLFAEDYLYLVLAKYENKKLYNNDIGRFMEWEEVVEDYMMYGLEDYSSIFDYINENLLGPNSNCELK